MNSNKLLIDLVIVILLQVLVSVDCQEDSVDGASQYEPAGLTPLEILRARGYLAEEFYFTTKDGYILNIVRGTNPLINGGRAGLSDKAPVLFIHGTISSAGLWLLNSAKARPKDFTNIQVNSTPLNELTELIGDDPSAKSMPLLAMNFGYEVWLLNRRGTFGSENRLGGTNRTLIDAITSIVPSFLDGHSFPFSLNFTKSEVDNETFSTLGGEGEFANQVQDRKLKEFVKTFDPMFWNFSLDEQVEFDIPGAIDFVLEKTGKDKLITFCHSSGGALLLMKLSATPELADKISKSVLWAPALNLGHDDSDSSLWILEFLLQNYIGPFPFTFLIPPIQAVLRTICSTELTQTTICLPLVDSLQGSSGKQQPIEPPIYIDSLQPSSSREVIHLAQFVHSAKPQKFQYNSAYKNIRAYGQLEPPVYDLSRIRLEKMSFYAGVTDTLVSPTDVQITVSSLTVPYRFTLINGSDIFFNHIGYFSHKNATNLVILPSLKDIEHLL